MQAMTRHSLLPSQPTSLDLRGLPLPVIKVFRFSDPLGEADWTQNHQPLPWTPASCVLPSFLSPPLGPAPGPSAFCTPDLLKTPPHTPSPTTDEERGLSAGRPGLGPSWLGSKVPLLHHSFSGSASHRPPGLELLYLFTKTSRGLGGNRICRHGSV